MVSYKGDLLHMESFAVTPGATGLGTVGLEATPTSDDAIMVWTRTALKHVEFSSRSGTSLVLLFRDVGTRYDKTGTIDTTTLPAGVSVETGGTITTGAPSASGKVDPTTTGAAGGAASGATSSHTHGFSKIFGHAHKVTETALGSDASDLLVTSGTVNITVLYAE